MIQFRKLDGFCENIDLIFVIQMCECKIFYNKSSFIKIQKFIIKLDCVIISYIKNQVHLILIKN